MANVAIQWDDSSRDAARAACAAYADGAESAEAISLLHPRRSFSWNTKRQRRASVQFLTSGPIKICRGGRCEAKLCLSIRFVFVLCGGLGGGSRQFTWRRCNIGVGVAEVEASERQLSSCLGKLVWLRRSRHPVGQIKTIMLPFCNVLPPLPELNTNCDGSKTHTVKGKRKCEPDKHNEMMQNQRPINFGLKQLRKSASVEDNGSVMLAPLPPKRTAWSAVDDWESFEMTRGRRVTPDRQRGEGAQEKCAGGKKGMT